MEKFKDGALLKGFTVNIKNAKGEVESLKYALRDIEGKTGQSFQYTGGSINDAGAIKQIKDIDTVTALIVLFVAGHSYMNNVYLVINHTLYVIQSIFQINDAIFPFIIPVQFYRLNNPLNIN